MKHTIYPHSTQKRLPGQPLRLLHAADLHLGLGWGRDKRRSEKRREEGFDSLRRLLDLASREQVHLLLLAGDVLETLSIGSRPLDYVIQMLGSLPCPVFLTPGNHDPLLRGSPYAERRWPENVHIFGGEWEGVYLPELHTTVWGIGFTRESERSCLLPAGTYRDWLQELGQEAHAEELHLGIIHGQVSATVAPEERYNGMTPAQLAATGLPYLALGHVHKRNGLQRVSDAVCWSYPGCLQGNGFDELGARGAQLITLSEKNPVELQFVPVATREFRLAELPLEPRADLRETRENLLRRLREKEPDYAKHYYRLCLTGPRPRELPWSWEQLEQALSHDFHYLQLRDETKLTYELDSLREEISLRGEVVRRALADIEACGTEEEREELKRALDLLLTAFDEPVHYGGTEE